MACGRVVSMIASLALAWTLRDDAVSLSELNVEVNTGLNTTSESGSCPASCASEWSGVSKRTAGVPGLKGVPQPHEYLTRLEILQDGEDDIISWVADINAKLWTPSIAMITKMQETGSTMQAWATNPFLSSCKSGYGKLALPAVELAWSYQKLSHVDPNDFWLASMDLWCDTQLATINAILDDVTQACGARHSAKAGDPCTYHSECETEANHLSGEKGKLVCGLDFKCGYCSVGYGSGTEGKGLGRCQKGGLCASYDPKSSDVCAAPYGCLYKDNLDAADCWSDWYCAKTTNKK